MLVLVINSGSSSIKFDVFECTADEEENLFKGLIEGIGEEAPQISWKAGDAALEPTKTAISDHREGLTAAIREISRVLTPDGPPFSPEAIGHRVVHGGDSVQSKIIDDALLQIIEDNARLAPLHNPPNLLGIRACMEAFPGTANVAVFDTAFHARMPKAARHYALPAQLVEECDIYRYGFHGTSHRFVAKAAAELLEKPLRDLKLITCHLGNGASLAAVSEGRSIDTTMGFTPLEGLVMGTRSGDIDAGVVLHLLERQGLSVAETSELLNKKSGILGVSGVSNDMRTVKQAADTGDPRAIFALELYAYRIKQKIGAMAAVLNGLDALVFTAGVGENDDTMRARICSDMDFLGITVDKGANAGRKSRPCIISPRQQAVRVCVIPTNEELAIARDTLGVLQA